MQTLINKNWVVFGLVWGILMFLSMSIIFPLLDGDGLSRIQLAKSFAVWMLMGFVFGSIMKLVENRGR